MQLAAMREYAKRRGWKIALEEKEVGSGAKTRPKREELLRAARRREVDAVVVWRLDRWGRCLLDLIATLQELHAVGVGVCCARKRGPEPPPHPQLLACSPDWEVWDHVGPRPGMISTPLDTLNGFLNGSSSSRWVVPTHL